MAALLPGDDHGLRRRRDPIEHRVGRSAGGAASGGNTELDKGNQSPVGSFPLRIGMHTEPAVGLLPLQKARDHSRAPGLVEGYDYYSHSIVPGGFDVMSNTTRFTPLTSLTMRLLIRASTSYGTRAQSAVIASSLVTTRTATTLAYVRKSPITPTVSSGVSTANDCHTCR